LRFVVDRPVQAVVAQVTALAGQGLPPFQSSGRLAEAGDDHAEAEAHPDHADQPEVRLSARHTPTPAWLRPLLPLGLAIAVIALWGSLVWGWQVSAPPLSPGATYRVLGRQLALTYTPSTTPTVPSLLAVNFRGEETRLTVDQTQRERIGRATLTLAPAYPALWVATADGSARLSLPNRNDPQPAIGIVFADGTSEESVLLPELGAGLRLVRRVLPEPGFVLELYRSDEVQPVYRAELPASGRVVIPLARTDLELVVTTLPGLLVNVHYLPHLWLTWVGVALAAAGAAAGFTAAGWLIVQVAPWTPDRAVVIIQSSSPQWVDTLVDRLQQPDAPALPVQDT
jgi:hypothetical protein